MVPSELGLIMKIHFCIALHYFGSEITWVIDVGSEGLAKISARYDFCLKILALDLVMIGCPTGGAVGII